MASSSTPYLSPALLADASRVYQEGVELGIDWRETWERVKEAVRKRRPEPGKPGQPIPQLPTIPGPPAWLFWALVAYLLLRWD